MRSTTHSNEIGASAIRGAEMVSDAALWRPSASNSSTSWSNSNAERCTVSALSIVAMFTTNSPVSRMLTKVSFSVTPSDRGCRLMDSIGGMRPTTVKNEMGAMLPTPSVEVVLTQAMGRGRTLPIRSL